MPLPSRLGPTVAICLFVVAPTGCSAKDGHPGGVATGGSSGLGGSSNGGNGGAGGTSGGSAGQAGNAGIAGEAGSVGAGGAGSDSGPTDLPCTSNVAFRATGAAFVFPTPPDLAKELGALTYDHSARPVTIVLAAKPGGIGFMAVSATEPSTSGQVFPVGKQPELVGANISSGGFSNASAQISGWVRIVDQSGEKDILIENVELDATTSSKCATVQATVTAVIPPSQGSLSLELPGRKKTIAELAGGGSDGGQTLDGGAGYPLKMVFAGESTDFEFGSL
jgi:hypothetical protein